MYTGYEPRRLFNVVQFVMNDKEGSGNVSLEGAMQILYLRYGKSLLDAQLEEIFGTSDLNSGMPHKSVKSCVLPLHRMSYCVPAESAKQFTPCISDLILLVQIGRQNTDPHRVLAKSPSEPDQATAQQSHRKNIQASTTTKQKGHKCMSLTLQTSSSVKRDCKQEASSISSALALN